MGLRVKMGLGLEMRLGMEMGLEMEMSLTVYTSMRSAKNILGGANWGEGCVRQCGYFVSTSDSR